MASWPRPPSSSALNTILDGAVGRCNVGCQNIKAMHCGVTAPTKQRLQVGPLQTNNQKR